MTKISMFERENDGALLVIWKTSKGNLVGEVFNNGVEKRGKWDERATFYVRDNDATQHRVREYFGFSGAKEYWRRWA
jgi:hypothetical protein